MSENERSRDESNENKPMENTKSLPLKQNKPVRPQRLRIKTKQFYDVKLPTYEESQAKYEKFLYTLKQCFPTFFTPVPFRGFMLCSRTTYISYAR